ncbi:SHD1 domain-containing protein [Aeoliella sp.]|uniref:SHD1 domain-containing protein n=1 Tax=Aeoliella sp. TaxID=2795800 RepID=UPI003CCB9756
MRIALDVPQRLVPAIDSRCGQRRAFILLAAFSLLVALWCPSRVQSAEAMRTWTDSSGRHKSEAAFVRTDADAVQLKLPNGRLVSIPLSRLSKADQEYVAKLSENQEPVPPQVGESLAKLEAAAVAVWRQQGEQGRVAPGIVVRKEGDHAFVVFRTTAMNQAMDSTTSFFVSLGKDATSKVPATWLSSCCHGQMVLLTAPADQMPDPVPMEAGELPTRGQPVSLLGYQIERGRFPSATRVQQAAKVHRIFRAYDGTITSFRLEALPPVPTFGLVVNEQGQFIGVVTDHVQPIRRRKSNGVSDPPRFHTMQLPSILFADLDLPYQVNIAFAFKPTDGDNRALQFVVFVADPFEQMRNPRLRFNPRRANDKFRIHLDEDDPRLIKTESDALILERRAPDEHLKKVLSSYRALDSHITLVADMDWPLEGDLSREGLALQLVFETPDGTTCAEPPVIRKPGR